MPIWQSGLTLKQSVDIERVQCVAVGMMLGTVPYAQACATLGLKPLHVNRMELCKQFVLDTASEESRHNDLFKLDKEVNPLSRGNQYREHFCRKKRFYKSPCLS